MSTKKFIIKILSRIVKFAAITIITLAIIENPTVPNLIALGQMENSTPAFMLLGMYFSFQNIAKFVTGLIVLWFIWDIVREIYKFIKSIYKEKN